MNHVAKLFMNGRSQAIRLPKDFRVTGAEVLLRRVPDGILICEGDPWDACEEAGSEISESFFQVMERRMEGLKLEKRAWRDPA